jgi:hypothetical protein
MHKKSHVRVLGVACGHLRQCRLQVHGTPSEHQGGCEPGLGEAAADFVQLLACIEPAQLTAADRDALRHLRRELSLLVELGRVSPPGETP